MDDTFIKYVYYVKPFMRNNTYIIKTTKKR